jgi:hypothetical protein
MPQALIPLLNLYAKNRFCIICGQTALPIFESRFGGFSQKFFQKHHLGCKPKNWPAS